MKTRDQKIAKARELREEGLTYREIGERLGVAEHTSWSWLNPEARRAIDRRVNAKRTKAKNEWARENRAACPKCGKPMGPGTKGRRTRVPKRCRTCLKQESREHTERFIALRERGLLNPQIAEREGVPVATVAVALSRAERDHGLAVPPSPWYHQVPEQAA